MSAFASVCVYNRGTHHAQSVTPSRPQPPLAWRRSHTPGTARQSVRQFPYQHRHTRREPTHRVLSIREDIVDLGFLADMLEDPPDDETWRTRDVHGRQPTPTSSPLVVTLDVPLRPQLQLRPRGPIRLDSRHWRPCLGIESIRHPLAYTVRLVQVQPSCHGDLTHRGILVVVLVVLETRILLYKTAQPRPGRLKLVRWRRRLQRHLQHRRWWRHRRQRSRRCRYLHFRQPHWRVRGSPPLALSRTSRGRMTS